MAEQSGFTMVEVVIAAGLTAVVLAGVMTASKSMTESAQVNESVSEVTNAIDIAASRVEQILRPGAVSTVRMRATQADILAATTAGTPIPALGDWIQAPPLETRSTIQVQASSGTLPLNASARTGPRSLEFRIDAGETANGIDDDGDGLVDEGELVFDDGVVAIPLLTGVELCTFQLDGMAIRVTLGIARSSASRRVFRTSIDHVIYLRNHH